MGSTLAQPRQNLSAISSVVSKSGAKSETETLPLEVLHNLQYQHNWTDLRSYSLPRGRNPSPVVLDLNSPGSLNIRPTSSPRTPSPSPSDVIHLISGLPPRHSYLHPDFQAHLLKSDTPESNVLVQREWVLPLSLGETCSLRKLCEVFDVLPGREAMRVTPEVETAQQSLGIAWTDAKRVLMGMVATSGLGGDGTVVYYIMQEGEVKPRQNG